MKFTCVALDLDNCLAYHSDKYGGLFEIFIRRGVPENVVRNAYGTMKERGGFSLDTLISAVEEVGEYSLDAEPISKEFESWLSSTYVLYPDVKDFLSKTSSVKIPVAVITQGEKAYQLRKANIVGIPSGQLYVVPKLGGKPSVLRELINSYEKPIAFVDDRPDELDSVRENGIELDEVETFRIFRPDGLYRNMKSKFKHTEIKSLEEILG